MKKYLCILLAVGIVLPFLNSDLSAQIATPPLDNSQLATNPAALGWKQHSYIIGELATGEGEYDWQDSRVDNDFQVNSFSGLLGVDFNRVFIELGFAYSPVREEYKVDASDYSEDSKYNTNSYQSRAALSFGSDIASVGLFAEHMFSQARSDVLYYSEDYNYKYKTEYNRSFDQTKLTSGVGFSVLASDIIYLGLLLAYVDKADYQQSKKGYEDKFDLSNSFVDSTKIDEKEDVLGNSWVETGIGFSVLHDANKDIVSRMEISVTTSPQTLNKSESKKKYNLHGETFESKLSAEILAAKTYMGFSYSNQEVVYDKEFDLGNYRYKADGKSETKAYSMNIGYIDQRSFSVVVGLNKSDSKLEIRNETYNEIDISWFELSIGYPF